MVDNMTRYKSEKYKGLTITFHKMYRGYVGAKVPSRTSQYIGIGKSKAEAFMDAKHSIDKFRK